MGRKKRWKTNKSSKNNTEMWKEEQNEEYMKELFGLDYIVGYTEGGVPYGIASDEDNEEMGFSDVNRNDAIGEELPF